MSKHTLYPIILILFFALCTCNAQEMLTVRDAVNIALQNNYEIKIQENDLKVDSMGVGVANAGMLPTVDAVLTSNNSIQNSSQTRSSGEIVELDNAENNSLNYGVTLGWTLFDGFSMFARYNQLKEQRNLGEAEFQQTVLARMSDVMVTYFDLVQQQQQLSALDSTLVISKQRVDLAQNRFTIGKASKLEVLNAQVDLNTDQTTYLRQKESLANTKVQLNEILARETDIDFMVSEDFDVDQALFLPMLQAEAKEENPSLKLQYINKRIAELQLKQVKANRYPSVAASVGYNFSDSQSSLGFTTTSSARGWNYGFTARLNIFNGFLQHRNEKIANIQLKTSSLVIEQQSKAIESQLAQAYQTYLTNISLIELEKNNEAIAKENLSITLDKFKIGTIPTIEFRTAQLNYINAVARYNNALFQAKLSEITLKEIAGSLSI
ncbi:MAG: transporter [Cytophagaceae bacterium]|nr:transporter [Cytophagaceae bacterium]|tara:strand:+ start:15227 stop:16537 length:1311 start_codon:yes stop_codon:yes gene_type:complete